VHFDEIATPIGPLLLAADEHGLRHVLFAQDRYGPRERGDWVRDRALLRECSAQLLAWFGGELRVFALRLAAHGTPFQQRVWQALGTIPFGSTCSYRDIACALGAPTATRAVGAANGRNPLPIIVPCHRVIGADGSLTGFGGGLPRKRWLLAHEARLSGGDLFGSATQPPA
jgi:methylated-DNA-[protein]-cysteine S-methyltransferase